MWPCVLFSTCVPVSLCLYSSVLQKFDIEKYKPKHHDQKEYDYAKVINGMETLKNGLNKDGTTSKAITNLINMTYRFNNQSAEKACELLIQALTAANTVLDSYREGVIDGRARAISRERARACTHAQSPRAHTHTLSCSLSLSHTRARSLSRTRAHPHTNTLTHSLSHTQGKCWVFDLLSLTAGVSSNLALCAVVVCISVLRLLTQNGVACCLKMK